MKFHNVWAAMRLAVFARVVVVLRHIISPRSNRLPHFALPQPPKVFQDNCDNQYYISHIHANTDTVKHYNQPPPRYTSGIYIVAADANEFSRAAKCSDGGVRIANCDLYAKSLSRTV